MAEAVKELKKMKVNCGELESEESVADVGVSVDGSWCHTGFEASFCVVYAISVDTGHVLDYTTKYRICKECAKWLGKEKEPGYAAWYATHQEECQKDFDGSSQAMESACMVDLWERSLAKRGLRYTTFVGDGDSKGFRSVTKAAPYGPDVHIEKDNCIGHVQKRMGTRMRSLLREYKGKKLVDGKGLGGRGRLTMQAVDSFQVYYGIALRLNKGDPAAMGRATYAILYHYASTREKPQHQFCPDGEDSWCKFKQDIATGQETYRPYKYPLPEAVFSVVISKIESLAAPNLLETVRNCRTQNPNESIHSLLWALVPKAKHHSVSAYRLATALVCGHWNKGQLAFNSGIYSRLDIPVSPATRRLWDKMDTRRVYMAEKRTSEKYKKRRKDLHLLQSKKMDRHQYDEGGKSYEAGEFLIPTCTQPKQARAMPKCKKCGLPRKGHIRGVCDT